MIGILYLRFVTPYIELMLCAIKKHSIHILASIAGLSITRIMNSISFFYGFQQTIFNFLASTTIAGNSEFCQRTIVDYFHAHVLFILLAKCASKHRLKKTEAYFAYLSNKPEFILANQNLYKLKKFPTSIVHSFKKEKVHTKDTSIVE
ncbi:hypothetical protein ACJX0J_009751 [Zea mays]